MILMSGLMPMWLRRLLVCWWGGCGGAVRYDADDLESGCFWQCSRCGRRVSDNYF